MDTKIELSKTLLNILKDVRAMAHDPRYTRGEFERFDPELGLCSAVGLGAPSPELRSGYLRLLSELMEEWPEFSGYLSYPVPHPSENPETAFNLASPKEMWSPVDAYGAARLRLLDWLIAHLEAETET